MSKLSMADAYCRIWDEAFQNFPQLVESVQNSKAAMSVHRGFAALLYGIWYDRACTRKAFLHQCCLLPNHWLWLLPAFHRICRTKTASQKAARQRGNAAGPDFEKVAFVYWTGKAIHEDNSWAISVLKHINEYVDRIKQEDGILYAVYGTPAESLCHTQIEQFRKKYGKITGVSDREYVTNSFHCPVYADITPIEKQDIEYPLFHLCNGGQIQYVRYRS